MDTLTQRKKKREKMTLIMNDRESDGLILERERKKKINGTSLTEE